MLNQGLELKQAQKLSRLQIQTIKLIELSVQEFEQRVRAELEENPVLDDTPNPEKPEEDRDISLDELKEDDYIPDYKVRVSNWGKDPRPEYNIFPERQSFTQNLMNQLGFRQLNPREYDIAAFIIGSLDEDGYLRRDLESLVDDLAFRAGIDTDRETVERLLSVIQEFEPSGVGARDLRECLLLQLKASRKTPETLNAIRILEECFEEFSNRHFQKMISRLGIREEELKSATARILKLNPSPGGEAADSYEDQNSRIVPDFILTETDGKPGFEMPRSNIPELRINKKYADMITAAKSAGRKDEAVTFVKQKIASAKWFVEAIKQRQNTLSRTMQAILDFQENFFRTGDESDLRPMVLKDIAAATGFDISTISRVVGSKYIDTPFGVFPLKYFFSEGMENAAGDSVSTRELKKVLQECVGAENKKKPLSDEQIVEEFSKRGYKIARRTVAKYRDQLGIPPARYRREL